MIPLENIALESRTIIQSFKYCDMGLLALLLYDYLLTLDMEVSRIWTLRWGVPKILFFSNRYVVPVFVFIDVVSQAMPNLSPGLCKVKKWIAL